MAGRRLTANVPLRNPHTDRVEVLLAGTIAPEWAAAMVTTPGLLEDNLQEADGSHGEPPPDLDPDLEDDDLNDDLDQADDDLANGRTTEITDLLDPAGDTDEDLDDEEFEEADGDEDLEDADGSPVELRPSGAGWYEIVVDGEVAEKIRGKDAAEQAANAHRHR